MILILKNLENNNSAAEQEASANDITDANKNSNKEAGFKRTGLRYQCGKCNFDTINSYNMGLHREGHLRNQRIKCRLCNFSSNKKYVIARHLKLHHRDVLSASLTDRSSSFSHVGLIYLYLYLINFISNIFGLIVL